VLRAPAGALSTKQPSAECAGCSPSSETSRRACGYGESHIRIGTRSRLGATGCLDVRRVGRGSCPARSDRADRRRDIPDTDLGPIEPGSELPGGLAALYDGRGPTRHRSGCPEQRALVFADALTAPAGELRVWSTPWHEERALPALRALLELPFEHVVVSHGEPVHGRAAYERALERPPWGG
jgi:hypothetical protein